MPRLPAVFLIPFALVLFATGASAASDDSFKVIKLEQDVRNLERQVQNLARQLDELRLQLGRAADRPTALPSGGARTPASSDWLKAANWERIKVGMSELEVFGALGPPTTMRQEGAARVLLYALEIGGSGFLSGSVRLEDRAVTEIEKPLLK